MTRKTNRRKLRNFIVNKKQLAIVVLSTVYFFLSMIAVLTLITAPVYSDIFHSSEISVQRESAKIFILLSEKLTIALSAIFFFTIIPLIWLTHRLFGPLVNFAHIFRRVSRGDLTAQVYLRRGDLLKSEAGIVNEMIQSLLQTVSEVKNQNQQLVGTLNGLVDRGRTRNEPDDDLLEARKQALACEKLLAKFTTE
ncbi:MAG: methyl-accepting chemotaxis protein [Desulfobacterales bacterium]